MRPPKKAVHDPVPKGNHVARLYSIIHIGTVEYTWQGKVNKSDKIRLTFELCNAKKVFKEGDAPKPYSISREFGYSMGKKGKLRPFIESMIGTALSDAEAYAFDPEQLMGEPCLLNVVHEMKDGSTYSNIASASPLPDGMTAPELFNKKQFVSSETSTKEEIATLPDFLQMKIKESEEYRRRFGGEVEAADVIGEDDLPF